MSSISSYPSSLLHLTFSVYSSSIVCDLDIFRSQLSPEMEGQGYDVLDTYRSTTEAVDRNISLHSLLMEYDLSPLSDKISVVYFY